jgi:excisionase family DNA binding protein
MPVQTVRQQIETGVTLVVEPIALTISEASNITSLSRDKLYEAAGDGRLKVRRFGARTVVLKEDLLEFLRGLPIGPHEEPVAPKRSRSRTARDTGLGAAASAA